MHLLCVSRRGFAGSKNLDYYFRNKALLAARRQESYDHLHPAKSPRPAVSFSLSQQGRDDALARCKVTVELATDCEPEAAPFLEKAVKPFPGGLVGSKVHRIRPGWILSGGILPPPPPQGGGGAGQAPPTTVARAGSRALRHSEPGVLSLLGPQFTITLRPAPHLEGRGVAVGKVIGGLDELTRFLNAAQHKMGVPSGDIVVDAVAEVSVEASEAMRAERRDEVRRVADKARAEERDKEMKRVLALFPPLQELKKSSAGAGAAPAAQKQKSAGAKK
jgi:cyclophilin family peptidyl-prolyl cis-trans isomerase